MANNIIYTNRENNSWSWITIAKGSDSITLKYTTRVQGDRDVTATYPLEAEAELLEAMADEMHNNLECLIDYGWGPEPSKVIKHAPVI